MLGEQPAALRRVELSFDVGKSAALPEWARARMTERLAGRLAGGVLTVVASEQRSQLANRQGARARPGRDANERRLEAKRHRGAIKRSRRSDRTDPE